MKFIDRIFLWSTFSSVALFLIIKEMIDTFPEWLSFILIIIWVVALGYSIVGYPIASYCEDANCTKDVTEEQDG